MAERTYLPESENQGSIWPQLLRFGSQSAVYAAGTLVARLLGFVLIPVYTKHISIHDYGIIALLILVTHVVSSVSGLGLMNSMFRLWPNTHGVEEQRSLFSTVLAAQLVVAVAFFAVVSAKPDVWSGFLLGSADWGLFVVLAVSIGLIDMLANTPLSVLRMLEKPGWYVFVSLSRAFTAMLTAIYFVAWLQMGVAGVLWGNLLGALVSLILVLVRLAYLLRPAFHAQLLREMLPFGLWYMVGVTAALFWNLGDRYVLKYFMMLSAVGVYGLGHQLATSIHMVAQSFMTAFLPMGLKHPREVDGGRFVAKMFTYFTFGLAWIGLGFSLLSREVIVLLARNPDYYLAWQVVPLLTLSFVLYGLISGVEIGFYFAGIARYNTWIIIGAFAFNIALNIALIPFFGIMGAAMAAALASLTRLVLSWYWAQRVYRLPYEIQRVVVLLVLAVVMNVGLLIAGPWWVSAPLKVGVALMYPVILWMSGFLTDTERETIRRLVAKFVR